MGTKINNKLRLQTQVYKKEQIGKIKMRRQSLQREGLKIEDIISKLL